VNPETVFFQEIKVDYMYIIYRYTVPIYEVNRPQLWTRSLYTSPRCYNAEEQETEVEEDYHSIIKNTERSKGQSKTI